jgi:hypothetical protein
LVSGVLFAQAVDDVGGRFGHEGFVVELLVGGGEAPFRTLPDLSHGAHSARTSMLR